MAATAIQSTAASRPILPAVSWLTTVEKVLLTRPSSAAARQFRAFAAGATRAATGPRGSAKMAVQERDGALARDLRARRVVAAALVAIEAVAGRIDVDLDAARMGGAQLVDVGERDGVVGLAEMR